MPDFPRLRDLPEPERVPFASWLSGQTVPFVDGISETEQDFYYRHDYDRWKELTRTGWELWD